MPEPASWRELLKTTISNAAERERIATEIGVRSITLTRWISGETTPRLHNLRQLLHALPKPQRDELLPSLEKDFLQFADPAMYDTSPEIAYKFIMEVFDTRAAISDTLRFWTISRQVLQHAIRHLDPESVGIAITVVRCMPPCSNGKIHSLHESVGLGTRPWEGDLEPKALFLGAESLAGYVVTSGRFEAVQDLTKESAFLPAYRTENEVSAAAHPIMYAGRVAGCLLLASTQPNYFLSESRHSLIDGYTNLLSLAFEPEEFYPLEHIELRVMPPLEVQQTYFTTFRQLVLTILRESTATSQPLTTAQAEQMAWQQIEALLLHLPPQTIENQG